MQFLLPLLYSFVFVLLIYKIKFFAIESISKTKLTFLFLLKLLIGFAACVVYTQHYTRADFHSYFSDSNVLLQQIFGEHPKASMLNWDAQFENVLFNSSKTIIVLNAVLQFFSFGNFYVHVVFFCFFSFVGLTALYKGFIRHFASKNIQLIISVFLVPSILFWSSAVSKEAILITLVGLLVYITDFGLQPNYNLKQKIILVAVLVLLAFTKIYMVLAVLPVLFANGLIAKTSSKKIILKYIFVFALMVSVALAVKIIHPDYNVLQIIADRQAKAISEAQGGFFLENDKNFICVDYYKNKEILIPQKKGSYKIKNGSNYVSWKQNNMADTTFVKNSEDTAVYKIFYAIPPANTILNIKRIEPKLIDFIKYSPLAIINVLFQPTLFNIKSWLHLLVAVENSWFILILILAIVFYDKTVLANKPVFLFCIIFSLLIFALIGITTPVIGSMVRYRTVGLVFFVPVLLMMIDVRKIKFIPKDTTTQK